jgi:hypothetical protein
MIRRAPMTRRGFIFGATGLPLALSLMPVTTQARLRSRGMGTLNYYDLLAQANLQNCDPRDSACVANNVTKQAAVEDFWVQHMATGVPDDTVLSFAPLSQAQLDYVSPANPLNAPGDVVLPTGIMTVRGSVTSSPSYRTSISPLPAGGASGYHPVVSFQNSRGASTLYPGDTWSVSITGGAPNAPVVVTGGKNGARDSVQMGTTDGSGKFSIAGTITSDQVGTWSESWTVGGDAAGTFSFTVGMVASQTPAGKQIINSNGASQPANWQSQISSFSFSSIPVWGWALAGVGALFFVGGARGR